MEQINNKTQNPLILIVDDIPKNIELLAIILQEYNYEIAFANNGLKALELVEELLPDLILLDVSMPQIDGYDVCKRLKEIEKVKEIPVIFLTAKTETEDIVKGFELGAVDYITKPFKTTELLARVNTHIELKRSKEQLNKAYNELKELYQMKEDFIRIASHDLKSPFTVILGFLQLLLGADDISEKHKTVLTLVREAAANQLNYVNDLLEVIRLEAGEIKLYKKKSEIAPIILKCVRFFEPFAKEKQITFATDINLKETGMIMDNVKITQVLNNLITNAIKFTFPNGKIEIKCFDNADDEVEFHVIDNGKGIPENIVPILFNRFIKHHTLGTANEEGSGLGLAICKNLIELHKGKIAVKSVENQGSDFYFILPKNALAESVDYVP